jgi:hypothetical protein
VQRHVPGRTDVQCRERWVNVLDPGVNCAPWTPEVTPTLSLSLSLSLSRSLALSLQLYLFLFRATGRLTNKVAFL